MPRILVIDDDLNLLQMVKLMLTRVGHEVEIARDGKKGLALAAQNQPDLLIIDVMMPDLSGYDVVRGIRDNPATANIPVIILTARSQPMDKHMALEAGANAFLSKPVTAKELTERVEAVIQAGVHYRVHTGLLTEPIPPRDPGDTRPLVPAPGPAPAVSSPRPDFGAAPITERRTPPPSPLLPPAAPEIPPQPQSARTRLPIGIDDLGRPADIPPARLPVLTLISLRGGVGTTTAAVNLALLLAKQGERTCLVDLSPNSGHAHLHLHLPGQKHWGALATQGDLPDARVLAGLLVAHSGSGLSVLAAPPVPTAAPMSSALTLNTLRELCAHYARVVVDARSFDPAVIGALRVSSAIVVVLADDPPSIQSAGQLLLALQQLGIEQTRLQLVLNHIRAMPDVPVDTIQKALKHPVNTNLPYEPGHLSAIRRGVPMVLANPEAPYSRMLAQLARALLV